MRGLGLLFSGLLLGQLAHSHHSTLGLYDVNRIIEIEGTVTSVFWRNPHPTFTIAVLDENTGTVEWDVEGGGALSTLRLRGIDRDVLRVGDRVRVAGEASIRGRTELFAHNFLLENGQEVLLSIRSKPRWPAGLRGDFFQSATSEAAAEGARRTADGIFRVWTVVLTEPTSVQLYRTDDFPLTELGTELKAQWDPRTSPYLGCQPRGMPYLMNTSYPIEFERRGADILLRMELTDSERLIHMDPGQEPAPGSYSLHGHSTGRWEDDYLIVETDGIDAPYFYGDGTPQSRAIQLLEYFRVNETGDRLDYRLVVNDPETFAEEMEFTRYWTWKPHMRVESFNCQE